MSVRPATVRDAGAIARVHLESTKAAYKGIFSEQRLNRISVEERERLWAARLAEPNSGLITLVGSDESGTVVGFVSGGAERTGGLGCDGELHVIYLLPSAQRHGLGTLLARRFAGELRSSGFSSMAVWVLARNPARKFYETLGGTVIAGREIERDGEAFAEIAYGWSDPSKFFS